MHDGLECIDDSCLSQCICVSGSVRIRSCKHVGADV